MSRAECAEQASQYLFEKTGREYGLDANYIGKLERGEFRWPGALYREALRAVMRAETDAELGFYPIRRTDDSEPATCGTRLAPGTPTSEAPVRYSGQGVPALTADDLRNIAVAVTEAGKYADAEALPHFQEVLSECAANDGALGPRRVIATVLGGLAAIERTAHHAHPATRAELLRIGARTAEFAGFLYRDLGTPTLAEYWQDRAVTWARDIGDFQLEAYVLLRKSQAAWDERDAGRMLALANLVGRRRGLPYRLRAEVAQQQARAMAMLGSEPSTIERQLGRAQELFAREEATVGLSSQYREPVLQAQAALCLTELGQPSRAIELLDAALASNTFSYRDRGYFTSQLAFAHAAGGDCDRAALTGLRALSVARATDSVRTQRELRRLVRQLDRATGDAVGELRHEITAIV